MLLVEKPNRAQEQRGYFPQFCVLDLFVQHDYSLFNYNATERMDEEIAIKKAVQIRVRVSPRPSGTYNSTMHQECLVSLMHHAPLVPKYRWILLFDSVTKTHSSRVQVSSPVTFKPHPFTSRHIAFASTHFTFMQRCTLSTICECTGLLQCSNRKKRQNTAGVRSLKVYFAQFFL